MRKLTLLIAVIAACNLGKVNAQSYVLYGTTQVGGTGANGTLYSYNIATGHDSILHNFTSLTGILPLSGVVLDTNNGLYYGGAQQGGQYDSGAIYSYNPANGQYNVVHAFTRTDGAWPFFNDFSFYNGLFYGMTTYGGTYNQGVIFSFNPANNSYQALVNFDDTTGAPAYTQSVGFYRANGIFYGITWRGGATDQGTIFSFNPATNKDSTLVSFTGANGANPINGIMTFDPNTGLLYGTTSNGGSNGDGVIFSFNIATGQESVVYNFDNTHGANPYTDMLYYPALDIFYGMTIHGGTSGEGVLYSLNANTGTVTVLENTNGTTGWDEIGDLSLGPCGVIYGIASVGGTYNKGTLFSYTPGSGAFSVLHNFGATNDGAIPLGNLTVVNLSGSSTSPLPQAPQVSVMASSNNVCTGNPITLTASGAATYSWNTGATTSSITVSPANTTIYSVTGASGNGCSVTLADTVIIATPTITITPSSATVNAGVPVSLIASGANYYSWSPTTGLIFNGMNEADVTASPTVSTTYTVTGTNAQGCTGTQTVTITITTAPTIFINPPAPTICVGSSVKLTASGGTNYSWSSGHLGASLTVSPTTTTTYTVTGTINRLRVSQVVTVTVNPLPTITTLSPASVCLGNAVTLSEAANSQETYSWSPATGLSSTFTSSVVATPPTTTTYSVTVTINGCSSSTTDKITVNPLPNIKIAGTTTICSGDSTKLTVSGAGTGGTYLWNTGSTSNFIYATQNNGAISMREGLTFYVQGTNNNGCVNNAAVNVNVNPTPIVTITSSSPSICKGTSDILTANGASTYKWNTGSTNDTIVITPTASKNYKVTGTGLDGCKASIGDSIFVVNCIGSTCANPYNIGGGTADSTFTFTQGDSVAWFMFIPDSTSYYISSLGNYLSTAVSLRSMVLYSGSCGNLKVVAGDSSTPGIDTIPAIGFVQLKKGEKYYLEISTRGKTIERNSFILTVEKKVTPSFVPNYNNVCDIPICGQNLAYNGDFEKFPDGVSDPNYNYATATLDVCYPQSYWDNSYIFPNINMAGGATAYPISSPNMRYFTQVQLANGQVYTCSFTGLIGTPYAWDYTNIYEITDNLPNSWKSKAESGKYFLAVDAPSDECLECSSRSGGVFNPMLNTQQDGQPYCAIAWEQQSIPVVPNVKYTLSLFLEQIDKNFQAPAGVQIIINGKQVWADWISDGSNPALWSTTNYNTWQPVNLCWQAGSGITNADIKIEVVGNPASLGYDVGIDNIQFGENTVDCSIQSTSSGCLGENIGTATAVVVGGTPPFSYSWNTTPIQTTSTITGLSLGNYSVTVTSATGCSSSASTTITVDPTCCAPPSGATTLSGPITINTSTTYSATPLAINGIITVAGGVTLALNNCPTVQMGTNAQIIVSAGATLNIQDSRLWSCPQMWQGILVQPGGIVNVNATSSKSAIIEDAITGIEGQSSSTSSADISLTGSGVLMNDNYIDIQIDPYSRSLPYPIILNNVIFTCQADGTYSSGNLKAPYNTNKITYKGIYLNQVGGRGTYIGNTTPGIINDFSNMNYGVYANSSIVIVVNNNFHNMYFSSTLCLPPCTPPPTYGVGVYGINHCYATVGGANSSGISQSNNFWDVYQGVHFELGGQSNVLNNTIYTTQSTYPLNASAGSVGVYVKTNPSFESTNINNNTITSYITGIALVMSGGATGSTTPPININSNNLSVSNPGLVMTTGISVSMTSPSSGTGTNLMDINSNNIQNVITCISLQSLKTTGVYPSNLVDVESNILHILPSTIASNHTIKSGISIQGCNVALNTVKNDIDATGSLLSNTYVKGIYTTSSNNQFLECNSIVNTGEDMVFQGSCSPHTQLSTNSFGAAHYGLVLTTSAVIGQQGSANAACDDFWATSSSFKYETYVISSTVPGNSSLYESILPSPNGGSPLAGAFQVGLDLFSGLGGGNPCISVHPPQIALAVMQSNMDSVVADSNIFPVYTPQIQYTGQSQVYATIDGDSTLMAGDSVLLSFYTQAQNKGLGKIRLVDKLIAQGNYSQALALNNSITPANTIEQNQQEVNNVFLSTLASDNDSLTIGQADTLFDIALQCPLIGGQAVYQARAMFDWAYSINYPFADNCNTNNTSNDRGARNIMVGDSLRAKVYPNPANSLLNVMVELGVNEIDNLCIYNSMGELVHCESLKVNLTTIPTKDLASGIYYYRIEDVNGNLIEADKVIVMH